MLKGEGGRKAKNLFTVSEEESEESAESGADAQDVESEEGLEDVSGDADSEEEEAEYGDTGGSTGNRGMADVISKILSKQVPEDKPAILSKRKRRKEDVEEKESKPKKKKQKNLDHQAWEDLQHVIPDGSRSEKERDFRRIATRGVVQLFNAVNKHQKDLNKELKKPGTTEAKRSKAIASVSKDHFLSMLRDGHGAGSESKDKNVLSSARESSAKKSKTADTGWAVLQDNFMMGAKLKDWDKDASSTASDNDEQDFEDSDSDES